MTTTDLALPRRYTDNQLALMRKTVAKGTTDDEFRQFMEACVRYNLDPFKKQIYAVLFSANDAEKRQMAIVVGIQGYRLLGYRAAEKMGFRVRPGETAFEEDRQAEPGLNPAKLLSATAIINVRYPNDDEWWPVEGKVFWEERAPISWDKKSQERKLARGPWTIQPRHMLAKCAEADAWRKIAPDDVGGLYIPEETDRPMTDITDQVERLDEKGRFDKVGGEDAILVQWARGATIEAVPEGRFADLCLAHIAHATDPDELEAWWETNRAGRGQFWARNQADAMAVKEHYEAKMKSLTDGTARRAAG